MSAEDELAIPQVPASKPDDPEDVSWALSTAEAMWAHGNHLDGIKWVRKAAEAASEAEADMRAVELAKAAADLVGLIARRSAAETAPQSSSKLVRAPTLQPIPATAPSVAPAPSAPSKPPSASKAPPPSASKRPPAPEARSMPPAPPPLPSKSNPPAATTASSFSAPRSAPPRPLATSAKAQGPAAGKGVLSNRPPAPGDKKGRRRSKENLEAEARAAGVLDTEPLPMVDAEAAQQALTKIDEMPAIAKPSPEPEPTVVVALGRPSALVDDAKGWDNSPTANLAGDEPISEGDRKTAVTSVAHRPQPLHAPGAAPHDPQIQTTQAVRVVVWRDASGVHVAPAGTVVSALKIDAILVALEPNADLTAWLTQQGR